MKKFLSLIFLAATVLLASCSSGTGTSISESDLIGKWVMARMYAPHTNVMDFSGDGTVTEYQTYDETGFPISYDWSLDGNQLTLFFTYTAEKINNDKIKLSLGGSSMFMYRKGTEPGGAIFDLTPVTLSTDTDKTATIGADSAILYEVAVSDGTNYTIEWEDYLDQAGTTFTGDVIVNAYQGDQVTAYSLLDTDYGYDTNAEPITATGTTLYLVVEPYNYSALDAGSFKISVSTN